MAEHRIRYQHRDLEHADSIRLLELEPADKHQDNLRGSLIHTTLRDVSKSLLRLYTALSYVWGSSHRTHRIYLNGGVFEITSSLDAALRDMRDSTLPHRIWADALCINQANNAEKSIQVATMGYIYSIATHTVIHLPISTPGLDRVLDDMLYNDSKGTNQALPGIIFPNATQNEPQIDSLRKELLAAPWFTRAWVFQELLLSQNPWVQINQKSRTRWSDFCAILGLDHVLVAMRLAVTTLGVPENHNPFVRMNETRVQRFAVSLHALLSARRGIGATDPRDVIYAHMGIISDREEVNRYLTVDYSKTTETLFFDTARYVLATAGIDTLLFHAPGVGNVQGQDSPFPGREGSSVLPSWVPNWSHELEPAARATGQNALPRRLTYLGLGGYRHLTRETGLKVRGEHLLTLSNPPTLSFTGLERDAVEALTMQIPRSALPRDFPEGTRQSAIGIYQILNPLLRWLEAFCQDGTDTCYTNSMEESSASGASTAYRQYWKSTLGKHWARLATSSFGFLTLPLGFSICFNNSVTADSQLAGGVNSRRLAIGRSGSLHLVPMGTREGDIIVDVGSSFVSLVLRPTTAGPNFSKEQGQILNLRIIGGFEEANEEWGRGLRPNVQQPYISRNPWSGPDGGTGEFLSPKTVSWGVARAGEEDVTPRIRHCVLVGEACSIRVDGLYYPWKEGFHYMDIFTLH